MRVLNSEFYSLTGKDSTVIVSNLSDVTRGTTWVEDLNRNAEKHSGPTFIVGSDSNDLIKGGTGNDYLEGRAGNDTFRDNGGFNIISGGEGNNTLDLQHALKNSEVAYDGNTLYLRDAKGGITLASSINTLKSKESALLIFTKDVEHQVTDSGLRSDKGLTPYASSANGSAADDTLTAKASGSWLFGLEGNDQLFGGKGNDVFVGGAGNDVMHSQSGSNTFLFSGDFGQDQIYGYQAQDKLVFMGTDGSSAGGNFRDFVSEVNDNLVFNFGGNTVTLVGLGLSSLSDGQVVLA